MKELDVRGLSCPQPVLKVKEALEGGNEELKVLVSEPHVVKNITKAVEPLGKKVQVVEEGLDFVLTIKKWKNRWK